jgi:hypothetical protein
VTLDGSDSSGDSLTFTWTGDAIANQQPVTGEMPTVSLPGGAHILTLTVVDDGSESDSDEVLVTVEDTVPPDLQVSGAPVQLWSPNHKYHRIYVDRFVDSVSDTCDGDLDEDDARFRHVSSDEPENATGDGNTLDDIVLCEHCRSVDVRAERRGNRNGRVYEARIVVTDSAGNETTADIDIAEVAKSQAHPAVDDDPDYVVDDRFCEVPLDLCPDVPATDCDTAVGRNGQSRLMMRTRRGETQIRWGIRGIDSALEDFGDPTVDTDYQLCLYGQRPGQTRLLAEPGARAGETWRARRDGFTFRARRYGRDGLGRAQLRARENARGQIRVQGEDDGPTLPIPDDAVLHVQLHNSDGHCWSADFSSPRRNTERGYSARSD